MCSIHSPVSERSICLGCGLQSNSSAWTFKPFSLTFEQPQKHRTPFAILLIYFGLCVCTSAVGGQRGGRKEERQTTHPTLAKKMACENFASKN
jgi:hypothetical protein